MMFRGNFLFELLTRSSGLSTVTLYEIIYQNVPSINDWSRKNTSPSWRPAC
jgi:hypothetical protein